MAGSDGEGGTCQRGQVHVVVPENWTGSQECIFRWDGRLAGVRRVEYSDEAWGDFMAKTAEGGALVAVLPACSGQRGGVGTDAADG